MAARDVIRRRLACSVSTGVALASLAQSVSAQVLPRRVSADSTPSAVNWQFDQCMGGLTYGAPYKWALSYGMGFVRESPTSDWCILSAAKVGLGGASLNVGVANSLGHFGSGASLTAGILRTFDNPLKASARRTYVGGALHVWPILGVGGEIGLYTRVGKDPVGFPSDRRIVTWSTGFGF